jgi:hypothetical protein
MTDNQDFWPVLEHSGQKKTGIIRKKWTRHVAGSKKGAGSSAVCHCQNYWVSFILEYWKFQTLVVSDLLKFAGLGCILVRRTH